MKSLDTDEGFFSVIESHYKDRYASLVKSMSFKLGNHHLAEDTVQEAYYRAMKYRNSCQPERFDQWFTTVLRNCIRDTLREQEGRPGPLEDDDSGTECTSYPNKVMSEIVDLIQQMEGSQREVLELHFMREYKPIDISRVTDSSYAKTHQIIQRFRNDLKDRYKG